MKQCLWFVFLFTAVAGFADEKSFTNSIPRDEFEAVGLKQLSPAQLKHLDELILAYKSPDVAAARRVAEEAITAQKAAEAEVKAAKDEMAESKKSTRGFLAKAKVLLVPGTKIEYAVVKSTVEGKFEGWNGSTVFRLANGQRWQVANRGDHYFTPPEDHVEVQVSPTILGGYWMSFPALNAQVRVKLLSDN